MTIPLKELRSSFEDALNIMFKEGLSQYDHLKITKRKVTIKVNDAVATIDLVFHNKTRSYTLIFVIKSEFLQKNIQNINPPYESNLANDDYIYCMSSAYSDNFNPILPITKNGITKVCTTILNKLKNNYIPKFYHLINYDIKSITDIIDNPKNYSYPLILCLLTLKENTINKDDIDTELLLSKKLMGYINNEKIKISFNKKLLENYFD